MTAIHYQTRLDYYSPYDVFLPIRFNYSLSRRLRELYGCLFTEVRSDKNSDEEYGKDSPEE
jgi:hypothetical protein